MKSYPMLWLVDSELLIILSVVLACAYLYARMYFFKTSFSLFYKKIISPAALCYPILQFISQKWTELPFWSLNLASLAWGFLIYAAFGFLILDFSYGICHLLQNWLFLLDKVKNQITEKGSPTILLSACILTLIGFWQAMEPMIHLSPSIPCQYSLEGLPNLRIAVVSDIRLQRNQSIESIQHWVREINALEPDLVLFMGNLIDDMPSELEKKGLGRCLDEINAPLGCFSIRGAREYAWGADAVTDYLESHGVKVLNDEYASVVDSFYLVGREPLIREKITNQHRLPLASIMEGLPEKKPIIVLDSHPLDWREATLIKADLYICGIPTGWSCWPFSYFNILFFGLKNGLQIKGKTYLYQTTGYTTQPICARMGSRPELALLQIRSTSSN